MFRRSLVLCCLLFCTCCVYAPNTQWTPHVDMSGQAFDENTETHVKPSRKHKKPKTRKDVADIKQQKKK